MTHKHINQNPLADSAGVPWEGRSFEPNPHAGDDGSADPALIAALEQFRNQKALPEAVVAAFAKARLLVPLVAHVGETGIGAHGQVVDKSADLSIVSVASPDGQVALPVFSSVATMAAWNKTARPVPIEATRIALAAASEKNARIILDAGSVTEFVIRQGAYRPIAEGKDWVHPARNPQVKAAFAACIDAEPLVENFAIQDGDPTARLQGAEVVVFLKLPAGLTETDISGLAQRLGEAWGASELIAAEVDSIALRLV